MLLELRKLMTSPGETLPFETSVDLSDMPFGGCKPVTEPVLAKGQVRNTAGVLEMTGTVETVLHGICAPLRDSVHKAGAVPPSRGADNGAGEQRTLKTLGSSSFKTTARISTTS